LVRAETSPNEAPRQSEKYEEPTKKLRPRDKNSQSACEEAVKKQWLHSQRPFAIVIVGGLIMDLLLGVFLLPNLYVLVARDADELPREDAELAH
jgi:hypothetical protein